MQLQLSGQFRIRIQAVLILLGSGLYVLARRILRGPLLPSWSLPFELSTRFLKALYRAVYRLPAIRHGRELMDALVPLAPSLQQVAVDPVQSPVRGAWFRPPTARSNRVVLYLHGAYAFYAKAERGLIADLAVATGIPVFALDYRLTPEHPFPAQLEDAIAAYEWLLHLGHQATDIVVVGASAGGNLSLSLVLNLRDSGRPTPGLTVGISPWTDLTNPGASVDENEPFDSLERSMVEQGAAWLVGNEDPRNPALSPGRADLRGLPPIYLQAGGREIFIDMIRDFYHAAKAQGVDVELDIWDSMNHVFQALGDRQPEAREAIRRIAARVHQDQTVRGSLKEAADPAAP